MDYAGNSNKAEEKTQVKEKKIEKIVLTGEVIQTKKPLGARMKHIFFGGEFRGAMRYVAADVLLPAFRNLVVDATTKGIERVIYGESAYSRRRGPSDYRPRVQYNNPINRRAVDPRDRAYLPDQPPLPASAHGRSRTEVNELTFPSRADAELVLERMTDIIDVYEVASVADLYDLIGLATSHVDNKWGWIDLNKVEIRQTRNGYVIDFPAAEAI